MGVEPGQKCKQNKLLLRGKLNRHTVAQTLACPARMPVRPLASKRTKYKSNTNDQYITNKTSNKQTIRSTTKRTNINESTAA